MSWATSIILFVVYLLCFPYPSRPNFPSGPEMRAQPQSAVSRKQLISQARK